MSGAAGYIGSHITHAFLGRGEQVVALYNLSTGNRALVSPHAKFVEGDAGNPTAVRPPMRDHGVTAVIHCAGSVVVSESVVDPLKYYENNTSVSRSLIEVRVLERVKNFFFPLRLQPMAPPIRQKSAKP